MSAFAEYGQVAPVIAALITLVCGSFFGAFWALQAWASNGT